MLRPVLQAALFCQEIQWDNQGRLSLLNALSQLPRGKTAEFALVNFWRHDDLRPAEFREEIQLRDPDGRLLGELRTSPFSLGGERRTHFSCIRFHDANLPTPGTYAVRVALLRVTDDLPAASVSIPLAVT